jgi:hypothetical protein
MRPGCRGEARCLCEYRGGVWPTGQPPIQLSKPALVRCCLANTPGPKPQLSILPGICTPARACHWWCFIPGIVLGPGDEKASGQYIQDLMRRRLPSTIFHDSLATYVYIGDMVEAMVQAAVRPQAAGQKYLVGAHTLSGRKQPGDSGDHKGDLVAGRIGQPAAQQRGNDGGRGDEGVGHADVGGAFLIFAKLERKRHIDGPKGGVGEAARITAG